MVRTYRASTGWRFAGFLLGGPLAVGGPWAAWLVRAEAGAAPRVVDWVVVAMGFGIGLLGLHFLVWTQRYRLTLSGHGITHHNGLWLRSRRSSEFRAFRRVPGQGVLTVRLLPRSGGRAFTVPIAARPDEFLNEWLAQFEDADRAEVETSTAELLTEHALGGTREERAARVERARRVATGFGLGGVALMILGFFWGHPAVLTLLLLSPWIVLAVVRWLGPAAALLDARNSARGDLGPALLLPGVALAARAVMDVQVLRWKDVPLPLVVAMLVVVALVGLSLRRSGRHALGSATLLLVPYTFGALLLGNALLDRAAPFQATTVVRDKRVQRSRNSTYFVYVNPRGVTDFDGTLRTGAAAFAGVQVGQELCLRVHPGAAGIRWVDYRLTCDDAEGQ
jgi:hypothetical protein